jgi:uncharacterized caspase-like protein
MPARLLSLLLLSLLVAAAPAQPGGCTYAVVVGIADYKALTYRTGDLRYADQDARQVARFLQGEARRRGGTLQLQLLTNAEATSAGIRRAMRSFAKATPADRVLLYFSGHGLTTGVVPYDVQPDRPASQLSYAAIKTAFRHSRAGVKLCITDACMSGSLAGPNRQPTATGGPSNVDPADGVNVAMLLASRSTEQAVEDRRLSAGTFTFFLLKGLGGAANQNDDNVVTIKELHRYVVPRVRKLSKGRQSPIFFGRFSDNLPLAYF